MGVRLLWNRSQIPFTNQVAGTSIARTMKGVWIMLSNVAGATGIVMSAPTNQDMNQSAESKQLVIQTLVMSCLQTYT
jgi:hypothetical protein